MKEGGEGEAFAPLLVYLFSLYNPISTNVLNLWSLSNNIKLLRKILNLQIAVYKFQL